THCYAMKTAARLAAMNQALYQGLTKTVNDRAVWTGEVRKAARHVLLDPLHRKKPTTYFVNSMSDLFHEDVPDEWIDEIFAVAALCPQHTLQVLTKRAERMRGYLADPLQHNRMELAAERIKPSKGKPFSPKHVLPRVLPNVWLGVSTERQQEADERIPLLLQTPAAVRFISAEPLLGPIDLTHASFGEGDPRHKRNVLSGQAYLYVEGQNGHPDMTILTQFEKPMAHLDWVIIGGESGHGHRGMDAEWAASLIRQCSEAGVPVFMKQMAGKKPI